MSDSYFIDTECYRQRKGTRQQEHVEGTVICPQMREPFLQENYSPRDDNLISPLTVSSEQKRFSPR